MRRRRHSQRTLDGVRGEIGSAAVARTFNGGRGDRRGRAERGETSGRHNLRRGRNITARFAQATELLHRLEIARDLRGLSGQEEWLRRMVKQHCLALSSFQRTIAQTRSRIDWLSEGDAITQFFHAHAKYQKGKTTLPSCRWRTISYFNTRRRRKLFGTSTTILLVLQSRGQRRFIYRPSTTQPTSYTPSMHLSQKSRFWK